MTALFALLGRLSRTAAIALSLQFAAHAADPSAEVHGQSDIFSAHGVTIAWGVLRGATEDAAVVVLRIAADPGRHATLTVEGVDPFTKERRRVVVRQAMGRTTDVRIPRTQFADFPRTELMFFERPAATNPTPVLTVYYLGVPDTAPEFASAAQLESFLAARIAEAEAKGPAK